MVSVLLTEKYHTFLLVNPICIWFHFLPGEGYQQVHAQQAEVCIRC